MRVRRHGEKKVADAFWFFTSYIWVSNTMSMATGREEYGFPKSIGIIDLPEKPSESFKLQTYGFDFAPSSQADWHPLVEIKPLEGGDDPVDRTFEELADLARWLVAAV